MAKFFGDIGKSVKDVLTGGVSYDNKLDYSTKLQGVGIKGNVAQKGEAITYSGTASYSVDKDLSAEATLSDSGEVKGSITHANLHPGLKATLSGKPLDYAGWKVATQLKIEDIGVKADLTNLTTAPKVDGSLCYNLGGASAIGVEGTVCSKKGLAKASLGYQQAAGDATLACIVSDMGDTVKASIAHKLDADTTAAVEVVAKLAKKDYSVSAGAVVKNPSNGNAEIGRASCRERV